MQNKSANFLARDFPTNQVLCWQSMRTQNSHWHACMHSFSWKYFPVEGWSQWPKQLLFVWNKLPQWILSSGSLAIISKAFDCFHGNTHCVSCHSNQCRTRIRVVSTVVMWPARFSTGFPHWSQDYIHWTSFSPKKSNMGKSLSIYRAQQQVALLSYCTNNYFQAPPSYLLPGILDYKQWKNWAGPWELD